MILEVARRCARRRLAGRPGAAVHRLRGGRARGRQGVRRQDPAQRLGLRLRPRLADRRDHRRLADVLPLRAGLPRDAGARRDPPRGRAQRDRGRRTRDRRDEARPPRRGDDREHRPHRGRPERRHEHRRRALPASSARCARWTPSKAEDVIAEVIAAAHDAANTPSCFCDVDVTTERLFDGYRHAPDAPAVLAAEGGAARLRLRAQAAPHGRRLGRQRLRGQRLSLHEPRQRHRAKPRARRARQRRRAGRNARRDLRAAGRMLRLRRATVLGVGWVGREPPRWSSAWRSRSARSAAPRSPTSASSAPRSPATR